MTLQRKKEIGIVVLVTLYTFLFFLLVAVMIGGEAAGVSAVTIVAAIGGLLWVAFMACALSFLANRPPTKVMLAAMAAVALAVFGQLTLAALVGAALLFIMILLASSVIRGEMNNLVQFQVYRIFRVGSSLLLGGLLIAFTALSFPEIREEVRSGQTLVPQAYVDTVVKPATPIISQYIEGFTPESTVNDLINVQIAKQTAQLPPGFIVPPQERDRVLRSLSEQFGVPVAGGETVSVISTRVLNQYLQDIAARGGPLVTLILIILAVLTLRTLVALLVWPALAFVAAVVYVSERVGLIFKVKTQAVVERIHL